CRRRACVTVSGGLKRTTSTASAATTVKAARWCRKAMNADAGMGRSGRGLRVSLLVPAGFVAQAFGTRGAALALETPFARRARRPCGGARLGHDQRATDELGEALLRVATVALLRPLAAGDDEDRAVGAHAPAGERPQARLDRVAERAAAGEVKAQLRGARHLVDVLPARTRGAHERQAEVPVGQLEVRTDAQGHRWRVFSR